MRNILVMISVVLGFCVVAWGQDQERKLPERVLWYGLAAEDFEQSLPLGNGRIGAVVYGRIETEHDNTWCGSNI